MSTSPAPTSTPVPTEAPSVPSELPSATPAAQPETTIPEKPSVDIQPASPKLSPGAIEITLIGFEPMKGLPGQPDYRSARLSYRINVGGPGKVEFPVIDFSVESPAGKIFQRHFELPGRDFLEPGPGIDRTVSLDQVSGDDWAGIYQKTDQAKFSWSIKGQSNGEVEKPVHKAWP